MMYDEMPEHPAICSFNLTYNGVCVLSPWNTYVYKAYVYTDVSDYPYLKVLEERDD